MWHFFFSFTFAHVERGNAIQNGDEFGILYARQEG
jgi:hypothetical protein